MKRSTDRFLTTHTGSLPRPDELIRLMYAVAEGVPVDRAALDARIHSAVEEVVKKQIEAGVDAVNDGEMSKPSYSTYVKDRVDGFGGTDQPKLKYQDLADFPPLLAKAYADPGRQRRRIPSCNAPIRARDTKAVEADIANLKAAAGKLGPVDTFMSSASPGVIAIFFHNGYYKTREDYIHAIAEAMRPEYEAIARAGLTLQIDCPDFAMGRHIQFPDASVAEFRKELEINLEALNSATKNIPPDQMRMHLCWGNYDGPHHYDVPLKDVVDVVFRARPSAISFEAANPRHAHEWEVFEEVKLPAGKMLIPGVLESKGNFIEHPELIAQRIGRYAKLVGRENVMAGSDCGYGTWVGQAAVDAGVVFAKLAAMAEGARLATKEFWDK